MTNNAPERILAIKLQGAKTAVFLGGETSPPFDATEYIRLDLYNAVCAERDALDEACITWSEVSQRNYQRAKAAEAEVTRLRDFIQEVADGHPKDYSDNMDRAHAALQEKPHE